MISLDSRVEHADTGEQGVVVAILADREGPARYDVAWDNDEHTTPMGVLASKLIELRSPKATFNESRR